MHAASGKLTDYHVLIPGGLGMQVQYKFGELSHEKLKAEGASVKFTPIPGMPHTAFPDELQQLLIFWQDVLPPLK